MASSPETPGQSIFTSKTQILGLKLYVVIIATVVVTLAVFVLLFIFYRRQRSSRRQRLSTKHGSGRLPLVCKTICEVEESDRGQTVKSLVEDSSKKVLLIEDVTRGVEFESDSKKGSSASDGSSTALTESSLSQSASAEGLENFGWGRWYSFRELEVATNLFSRENVIGEGGYGVVYRAVLTNGSVVAVKNLLNKKGHAEKEFKVEVEAIGKVRHKNLVGLIGYCAEGVQRLLVYEYIDNGNLEQWLHGDVGPVSPLTWEIRMKIAIGTARGKWNAKVSDFGLVKMLGSEKSYVTTRVMGTFGYVSPDYASTGMLNEGSDVYSFGVLLMEIITGRSPIDYSRPPGEMNLIDWFKGMVASRRGEELVDPLIGVPPPSRALKRALLACLRCMDLDASKRPKMGQIVHVLEADEFPYRGLAYTPQEHRPVRNTPPLYPPQAAANKNIGNTQKDMVIDEEKRIGWR